MKLKDFNQGKAAWDALRRPYHNAIDCGRTCYWGGLPLYTQLRTGELIVTSRSVRPDMRGVHNDIGLAILSTTDKECPALHTPDGAKLTTAALTHKGQQILLFDRETKRAVRIDQPGDWGGNCVPKSLRSCASAYVPGDDCAPIGSAPVDVWLPRTFTEEEQEHIKAITAACRAFASLEEINVAMQAGTQTLTKAKLCDMTFNDLTKQQRINITAGMLENDKVRTQHDYLTFAEKIFSVTYDA